jgi:glycine dehydrogenase subunit 1
MGPEGLRKTAILNHVRAGQARAACVAAGAKPVFSGPVFNEFVVRSKRATEQLFESACGAGVIPGVPLGRFYPELSDCLLVCATEQNTPEDIQALKAVLS